MSIRDRLSRVWFEVYCWKLSTVCTLKYHVVEPMICKAWLLYKYVQTGDKDYLNCLCRR